MTITYAPIFKFGDDEWRTNSQRFANEREAHESAEARFRVWTMPTDFGTRFRVWTIPTDFGTRATNDQVTHRRENGKDVLI